MSRGFSEKHEVSDTVFWLFFVVVVLLLVFAILFPSRPVMNNWFSYKAK